jgi:hypothetical protein
VTANALATHFNEIGLFLAQCYNNSRSEKRIPGLEWLDESGNEIVPPPRGALHPTVAGSYLAYLEHRTLPPFEVVQRFLTNPNSQTSL